jgi:hypothetical protein
MGTLPEYHDLPTRAGLPASWGLWGDDGTDVFGCLNLLTPERVAAAARLVQRGAVFALNGSLSILNSTISGNTVGGELGSKARGVMVLGYGRYESATATPVEQPRKSHSCSVPSQLDAPVVE